MKNWEPGAEVPKELETPGLTLCQEENISVRLYNFKMKKFSSIYGGQPLA